MFRMTLLKAAQDAIQRYNEGLDDKEAIKKTAEDYGFNMEQTRRLVETYNTAKTISFFKQAEDRTEHFNIVPAEDVLVEMFDKDKIAEKFTEAEVDPLDSYLNDIAVREFYNRPYKKANAYSKEEWEEMERAMDSLAAPNYKVASAISDEGKAIKREEKIKEVIDIYKNAANEVYEYYLNAITKIGEELQVIAHASEDTAADAIASFASNINQNKYAASVIKDVLKYIDNSDDIVKKAEAIKISEFDRMYPELSDLFKQACYYASEVIAFNDKAKEVMEKFSQESAGKNNKKDTGIEDLIVEVPKGAVKGTWKGVVEPTGGTIKDLIDEALFNPLKESIKQDVSTHVKNILHNKEEKAIEKQKEAKKLISKNITEQLAVNPSLRNYDPEFVLEQILYLYNDLGLKDLATSKQLLATYLNQVLNAQGLSPYDIEQLVKADLAIRKSKEEAKGAPVKFSI